MKTEQIEVPHFEGFECIGLAIPDGNEYYVLSPDGSRLIQLNGYCMQPCYKKIPPRTMTLMYIEYGIVEDGDFLEYVDNNRVHLRKACVTGLHQSGIWRPI